MTQGNKVPADIRLVELKTISLKINQSILTGEVNPVSKNSDGINQDKLTLQGKLNYAFSGTLIASGTAIGVVVETGNYKKAMNAFIIYKKIIIKV